MGRKERGVAVPLSRGSSSSNTMWPVPSSTSVPTGVFIHPAVWPQYRHEPKTGAVPLLGGAATPSNTTSPGPMFTSVPSAWHLDPSGRFATIDEPKIGWGGVPFFGGSWVSV